MTVDAPASPVKTARPIRKSPSPQKSPHRVLKNDASKFRFVLRPESVNGLSLLDRIKLKEISLLQDRCRPGILTPQQKYSAFLLEKSPAVYDILYHLHMTRLPGTRSTSHSLKHLSQNVRDSLEYPVSDKEATDIIRFICSKLSPRVSLVSTGDVSVIKMINLSRNADLAALKC